MFKYEKISVGSIMFSLSALTVVGGVSGISLSFDSETALTPPTTVRALRLYYVTPEGTVIRRYMYKRQSAKLL